MNSFLKNSKVRLFPHNLQERNKILNQQIYKNLVKEEQFLMVSQIHIELPLQPHKRRIQKTSMMNSSMKDRVLTLKFIKEKYLKSLVLFSLINKKIISKYFSRILIKSLKLIFFLKFYIKHIKNLKQLMKAATNRLIKNHQFLT